MHALVLALAGPDDHVIVPRNSHKALLAGAHLLGRHAALRRTPVDPEWGIPLNVRTRTRRRRWRGGPTPSAFFVTSPTYNGFGADLRARRR